MAWEERSVWIDAKKPFLGKRTVRIEIPDSEPGSGRPIRRGTFGTPIKTQWAEQIKKWEATYRPKSDPALSTKEVLIAIYDSEAEAKAATATHWTAGDCDSTSVSPIYRLQDGREFRSSELPPGSIYCPDPDGAFGYPKGPDGLTLYCVCPDGAHWCIDGRASNCTLPDDDVHRCWVRTGDPRKNEIDVGKGGLTCSAGAGSIQTGRWHGFLTRGVLQDQR